MKTEQRERVSLGEEWTRDDGTKWEIIFNDGFVKLESRGENFKIISLSFKDFFEQFSR